MWREVKNGNTPKRGPNGKRYRTVADFNFVRDAAVLIRFAIHVYQPVKVYALVSGGRDSTTSAHLASVYAGNVDALVHINTGIGIEDTTAFVRRFAEWLNMPLIEKTPPRSYESLVMEYGFPGPAAHRYMYSWLKERQLRQVRREAQTGRRDRVMFITGVRRAESTRRMGVVRDVQRDGNTVWVAPILNFSNDDVAAYQSLNQLPKNEVVDHLHMSAECLCGAFSHPGELDEIAFFYPAVAARIRRLESEAHARGVKSCRWGPQSSRALRDMPGMLCSSCVHAGNAAPGVDDLMSTSGALT